MKTIRRYWVLSLATFLFILMVVIVNVRAQAQNNQEVPPYVFAKLDNGTLVYKVVHQGCELFIAQNYIGQLNHADSAAVAITTGRGCK